MWVKMRVLSIDPLPLNILKATFLFDPPIYRKYDGLFMLCYGMLKDFRDDKV